MRGSRVVITYILFKMNHLGSKNCVLNSSSNLDINKRCHVWKIFRRSISCCNHELLFKILHLRAKKWVLSSSAVQFCIERDLCVEVSDHVWPQYTYHEFWQWNVLYRIRIASSWFNRFIRVLRLLIPQECYLACCILFTLRTQAVVQWQPLLFGKSDYFLQHTLNSTHSTHLQKKAWGSTPTGELVRKCLTQSYRQKIDLMTQIRLIPHSMYFFMVNVQVITNVCKTRQIK